MSHLGTRGFELATQEVRGLPVSYHYTTTNHVNLYPLKAVDKELHSLIVINVFFIKKFDCNNCFLRLIGAKWICNVRAYYIKKNKQIAMYNKR